MRVLLPVGLILGSSTLHAALAKRCHVSECYKVLTKVQQSDQQLGATLVKAAWKLQLYMELAFASTKTLTVSAGEPAHELKLLNCTSTLAWHPKHAILAYSGNFLEGTHSRDFGNLGVFSAKR